MAAPRVTRPQSNMSGESRWVSAQNWKVVAATSTDHQEATLP